MAGASLRAARSTRRPNDPRQTRSTASARPTASIVATASATLFIFSSMTMGTSGYRASTSASVGTPIPSPRNGNASPRRKRWPASARASSPAVNSATAPRRFVVRSSERSWWTTTTASRERRTSSSSPSAPRLSPCSNAASVFSGASAPPPRCANTKRRRAVKKRWSYSDEGPKQCSVMLIESSHGGPLSDPRRAAPAGGHRYSAGEAGNSRQPRAEAPGRRAALPRHHRFRRNGHPATRQRNFVAPQFHFARPPRAGEEPDPPRPHRPARRADSGGPRVRDPRRPPVTDLRRLPRAHRQGRRQDGDRVAAARGPLCREAGDARRDD